MCCLLSTLLLLGPRAALVLWWLVDTPRFSAAFNTFILPCLGLFFLPFTTLAYVLVYNPLTGVQGIGWVWVGLGLVLDLVSHGGGAYGNRNRIPGYARS